MAEPPRIIFLQVFLETRFSKKMEHVLLVDFDAWLVEWVDLIEVSAHGTGSLEEVEEIAKVEWVHFLKLKDDVVVAAFFGMGFDGSFKGFVLDASKGSSFEVVKAIEVIFVVRDFDFVTMLS